MPTLAATDIDDLVAATFPAVDKNKFNDLASTFQNHPVLSQMLKKERRTYEGGDQIERTLMTQKSGSAKNVGLHEEDDLNIIDHSQTITVPWRFVTCNWAYDVKERQLNRGNAEEIWNLVTMREKAAYVDMAEHFEDDFWDRLAATADTKKIFGVDYWINKANSTTGFNGGDPTGFAGGAGGLTVATAPNWKNYSAEYTNVTKQDFVKKVRVAIRKTNWKPPMDLNDYRRGQGQSFGLYTNNDVLEALEDLGESQNDNLGRDLASMQDRMLIRNFPVQWVPKLDDDAQDPMYGIDWNWFEFCIQRGSFMRRTVVKHTTMHDERSIHLDTTINTVCTNRRRQFVVEKA